MGKRTGRRKTKPLVVDYYGQKIQTEQSEEEHFNADPNIIQSAGTQRDGPHREIITVDVTAQTEVETGKKAPAAAYIRLSAENGGHDDEGTLINQIELVHDYINDRNDLELYDTYVDNGVSGTTFERPEFERMMEDVRRGRVQCVVVKDLSRFGRNYLEAGTYIERVFPLLGVRLIAVNDNFDSARPGDVNGLELPIKNLVNAMYAKDISRKVKAAFDTKNKSGKWLGCRAPYGYLKVGESDNPTVVPDPETAKYVRVVFQWFISGVPMGEIKDRLDLAGAPVPAAYRVKTDPKRERSPEVSGHWGNKSVKEILVNQMYTGDTVNGKTAIVNGKAVQVDRENWSVFKDTHEPLITREDYEKARAMLEEAAEQRKGYEQRSLKSEKGPVFKGKIYCGVCGRVLQISYRESRLGVRYHAYRCVPLKDERPCSFSPDPWVNEDVFKVLVMDQIRLVVKSACDYRKLAQELMSENPWSGKFGSIRAKITNAKSRFSQIEEREMEAYGDYAEGSIDKAEYGLLKEKLKAEKNRLDGIIRKLVEEELELKAKAGRYLEITEGLEEYLDFEGYQPEIVDRLVEKIEYFPGGTIKLTLKCEDVYANMAKLIEAEKGLQESDQPAYESTQSAYEFARAAYESDQSADELNHEDGQTQASAED